jgi:hypothetical protein
VLPDFFQMCNLEVPSEYKDKYRTLLAKHKNIFSLSKSDLGFCDTVLHKLFMKTEEPVYVKQFKIPEAHQSYLQDQVREWLRLGIIQPSRSRYNSPVFLVQKKDGTHRVVQDFRSLNSNTYVDKYSMKDVQECISEIGRAGSAIFTTLDLIRDSGKWHSTQSHGPIPPLLSLAWDNLNGKWFPWAWLLPPQLFKGWLSL